MTAENRTAGPVIINTKFYIESINAVSEKNMEFMAQFRLEQSWYDDRLSFLRQSSFRPTDIINVAKDQKIWQPDTFFANERNGWYHLLDQENRFIKVRSDGRVSYNRRLTLVLACNMNLFRYPMDIQECVIDFGSYAYTNSDIIYIWDVEGIEVSENANGALPNFEIAKYEMLSCDSITNTGIYSCLRVGLTLNRVFSFFLLQLYIPSAMLVGVSWVSYWIDWKSTAARVPLAIVTLLTMITQQHAINSTLPPVSYSKAIDVWIGACVVFIFSSLIEYAVVNYMGILDEHRQIKKIASNHTRLTSVVDNNRSNTNSNNSFKDKFSMFNPTPFVEKAAKKLKSSTLRERRKTTFADSTFFQDEALEMNDITIDNQISINCKDDLLLSHKDVNTGLINLNQLKDCIENNSWQVCIPDEDETPDLSVISNSIVYRTHFNDTDQNDSTKDKDFTNLVGSLMNRNIELFKPQFTAQISDSDENDDAKCDEESETRKQQHGSKTTEEEIFKTPDGREIRSTKTRIVNSSSTSKNVTVRSYGGGQDVIRKNFFDIDKSHNESSDDEFSETFRKSMNKQTNEFSSPFSLIRRNRPLTFDSTFGNSLSFDDFDNNSNEEQVVCESNNESQKIKKVDHSSATLQSVEKTMKRNGKTKSNESAYKLDTKELKAEQTETYDGDELIRKEGGGTFEENCSIGNGVGDSRAIINLGDISKCGMYDTKAFACGTDSDDGSYLKGMTMTTYILLNDSINNHEEQFRKKIQFEFRNNSPLKLQQEDERNAINLHDLLQLADYDQVTKGDMEKNNIEMNKNITLSTNILAIEEDMSIFESNDASHYLVFTESNDSSLGKTNSICRGGPTDALVVYATQNEASLVYKEAFLATYRSFTTSLQVLRHLVHRFEYMISSPNEKDNRIAHNTISVIIRILQSMSLTEIDNEIIRTLDSLYSKLYTCNMTQFVKILREMFANKFSHKLTNQIDLTIPSQCKMALNADKVKTFLNIRSVKIAQQITLINSKLFHKIEESELLWWSIDQTNNHCFNLKLFTTNFNFVSFWCRSLVLVSDDPKLREKAFQKFLKIAKYLKQFGDLCSYLAILSALDSGPLNRLNWSKIIKDDIKEHRAIMASDYSFRNYRHLFSQCKPPCIPYIGLMLQDLTFINNGTTETLNDKERHGINFINFVKCFKQYTILESVRKLKMWDYSFENNSQVDLFLNNFVDHYSEEETWVRSEMIKPRGNIMSFPINDSLLNFEDCHYLNLDTVIVGTGRDRVKFLDLEGRWKRSGQSCAAVARVFNHIEKLNYATTPLTDLGECSLNAIRGPTPITTKGEWKPVSLPKTEPIQVLIEDEVPASPREIVPHRSAGYGAAHERRRLSIPNERSRSPSVSSRNASPVPPIYNSQVGKGNIECSEYELKYLLPPIGVITKNRGAKSIYEMHSPGSGYYSNEETLDDEEEPELAFEMVHSASNSRVPTPEHVECNWYLGEETVSVIRVEEIIYYTDD
uniref:Neur_chan_LBD domain-containing protein n=1 Tax=Rhabditophanes sp. KR3021 TaxID=114890 RepID=A0AC35U561_9BILA